MKTWPVILGIFLLIFLISCSEESALTGGTVADVSTLTVIVRNENGSLMYGANIYVNDEFKGKTNKYGELRGTKEIVLPPGDNHVRVDAAGYVSAEPMPVSGSGAGQRLTFVLERPKTDYVLRVYDDDGAAAQVRITLSRNGKMFTSFTDEAGRVRFAQLEDGEYIVKLQKGRHLTEEFGINISRKETGGKYESAITLEQEAELMVTVTADDGTLLPEAQVSLYGEDDYNAPNAYPLAAKFTKEDGRVYFRNVEYGETYVVQVRREGFVAEQETLELRPGRDEVEIGLAVDVE